MQLSDQIRIQNPPTNKHKHERPAQFPNNLSPAWLIGGLFAVAVFTLSTATLRAKDFPANPYVLLLPAFDNVHPAGPWQPNSASAYAVASLIDAYGTKLNAATSRQLQQELDPDANGIHPLSVALYLHLWFDVDFQRAATLTEIIKQLDTGLPVLAIVQVKEKGTNQLIDHLLVIIGFTTYENGSLNSLILLDNGILKGHLHADLFQSIWEDAGNNAMFVRSIHSAPLIELGRAAADCVTPGAKPQQKPTRIVYSLAPPQIPLALQANSATGPQTNSDAHPKTYALPEFNNVKPTGSWPEYSSVVFAVACLMNASGDRLTDDESWQLQRHFDREADGAHPLILDYCLDEWCEIEAVPHATTAKLIEHLHAGYPVLPIVHIGDCQHLFVVHGYSTNENGRIDSWHVLTTSTTINSPLPDHQFQRFWSAAENAALFVSNADFPGPLKHYPSWNSAMGISGIFPTWPPTPKEQERTADIFAARPFFPERSKYVRIRTRLWNYFLASLPTLLFFLPLLVAAFPIYIAVQHFILPMPTSFPSPCKIAES